MNKKGLLLAAAVLLLPVLGHSCAICKDAWTGTSEGLGFAKGVYLSILLMLGMFFGMVGILVVYIVRQANKPLRSWGSPEQRAMQSPKL